MYGVESETGVSARAAGSDPFHPSWSAVEDAYPAEKSVHRLFAEQVARTPDAVVLAWDGGTLTFAELHARSSRLARLLVRRGVRPGGCVGFCLERGPATVVTMLAVLKAGAAYVPLDAAYPAERLAYMLADSGIRTLVTQRKLAAALLAAEETEVIVVDEAEDLLRAESPEDPRIDAGAEALAYVIYTSGSTGRPKGVAVPHRGIVRLVVGGGFAELGAGEVFLQLSPVSFDTATLEVWAPLLNGGRLAFYPPTRPTPRELGEVLRRHRVTTLWLTSGVFHLCADEDPSIFAPLRQLLAGGDVLSVPHARRVALANPGLRLINGYGPTENTTFTTCHTARPEDLESTSFPIGVPVARTTARVVDGAMRECGEGELLTGGDGLAWGYLGRPALTAERWIPDPFSSTAGARLYRTGDRVRRMDDGVLDFMGRIDEQVKIRGFRIELGEIEAVLRDHPAVGDAAVTVHPDGNGEKRLVGYVVPRNGGRPAAAVLRDALGKRLPAHMVPALFVPMDALPLSPNGKVDRRALPAPPERPDGVEATLVAPRTETEAAVAEVWREVLGVRALGVEDDVFELGAHSLAVTQVASRLRARLAAEVPLAEIFAASTVARLAAVVERIRARAPAAEAGAAPARAIVPAPAGARIPLSFSQERVWFLIQLAPENRSYNFQATITFRGTLDGAALRSALSAIVRRHEIFRTTFPEERGHPYQQVHPPFEAELPLVDLSPLAGDARAAEEARVVREAIARELDITRLPLIRWVLVRRAENEHVLVHVEHHLVHDGWSFNVFLRDLLAIYGALTRGLPSPLAEPELQFGDYAHHQRRWLECAEAREQVGFWRERLAGSNTVLDIGFDRPRPPEQSFRGAAPRYELPPEVYDRLRAASRHGGVTLFTTMLAAFGVLLSRWSGETDLNVGTAIANRRPAEVQGMIGMFVNSVVVRARLDDDPPFAEFARRVHAELVAAAENQELPFEAMVEAVRPERSLAWNPLFQASFSFHDSAIPDLHLPGLELEVVPGLSNGSAKFDINVICVPRAEQRVGQGRTGDADGITLIWEYASDLYDAASIDAMVAEYSAILEAAAAAPDTPVLRLPVPPTPRPALARREDDPASSYPADTASADTASADTASADTASADTASADTASADTDTSHTASADVDSPSAPSVRSTDAAAADSYAAASACVDADAMDPARSADPAAADSRDASADRTGAASVDPVDAIDESTGNAVESDRICIHHLFAEQARRTPDAPAVASGDATLTYRAMDERANRLARFLRRRGVRPESRVGVCMERGIGLLVAELAILKAGAAYLPIDPTYPAERIGFMLADASVAVLLTEQGMGDRLPSVDSVEVVNEDARAADLAAERADAPEGGATDRNLAYVVYTSGSTGRPKGVAVEHRGLKNLCAWHAADYAVTGADRAMQIASAGFDAASWEVWPYLLCGACVDVAPDEVRTHPEALRDWMVERGVTIGFLSTPVAEPLMALDWPADVRFRALLTGADRLGSRPRPGLPFALYNNYGPTECTAISTFGPVAAHGPALPGIGRPIANTPVYVLDAHDRHAPIGADGELHVGGVQVARGYLSRPALTAERFVPDPYAAQPGARMYRSGDVVRWNAGGTLDFTGRRDDQVKIRGFRIETGEVEAALREAPGVTGCVVLARDDDHGETRLVAYHTGTASADALRAHLRRTLPGYMVPAAFVTMDAFPLTTHAKVDRRALPAPEHAAGPHAVQPRGGMEERVAEAWREVLHVESVGADDNFFDVGGTSLMLYRVYARLREIRSGLKVVDLFRYPTIAALAGFLEATAPASPPAHGADAGASPAAHPPKPLRPDAPAERAHGADPRRRDAVSDGTIDVADTIHALFERQARVTPHAVALVHERASLTYAELDARANQLARQLRDRGVRPEVRVGVCLRRGPDLLVALLAVLKAGGAYVPLDPAYPAGRLRATLADAGAPVLVTEESVRDVVPAPGEVAVVSIDGDAAEIAARSADAVRAEVSARNLAYLIYTSGSTGVPKGVAIEHESAVAMLRWSFTVYTAEELGGMLASTSVCFDMSVFELFAPLARGGRVIMVDNALAFPDAPAAGEVRLVDTVPSAIAELVRTGAIPRGVKTVNLGGEPLHAELVDALYDAGVERVYDLYGPSEDTTFSTYALRARGGAVTIGRPIDGTEGCLLDPALRRVPEGLAGELYLGGRGVTRGYLGRPALTAERYLPDPFSAAPGARMYRTGDRVRRGADGTLQYLGRLDHQVKIRGYRVELGELEAVLRRHPEAGECVVIVRNDAAGEPRLLAYVTGPAAPDALRRHMRAALPEYMVPSRFVTIVALPRTPNGKLDRGALPAPEDAAGWRVARPLTAAEERLAATWREVLGVAAVGVHDDFFDLGGNSLQVYRVFSRIRALRPGLRVTDLFRYPTLEAFAAHLEDPVAAERDEETVVSTVDAGVAEPPRPVSVPMPPVAADDRAPDARRPARKRAPVRRKARVRASARDGSIAVVGMSCRFPGARNVDEFWANLREGVESIAFYTEEQLLAAGFPPGLVRDPAFVRAYGALEDAFAFDARFFGISEREAVAIDPQQRAFLEVAWSALEDAGCDPGRYPGAIGVYAGTRAGPYLARVMADPALVPMVQSRAAEFGNLGDCLATRASYKLGLRGPSMAVQTACSTSLVAIHVACRALLGGECDMALAGGVTIAPDQVRGYLHQQGGTFSPDGHCRTFDARADGTVAGSGAGVVVLKRLADALRDGDTIHAVVRGSAINNDGTDKVGYTAPSVQGQSRVIRRALRAARVAASSVGYVEAHGTATTLGDPIEIAALSEVFGEGERAAPCALGAVKTNIGHVDMAAGVAGFIKTVLALKHRALPPTLHFRSPNPETGLDGSPFRVNTEYRGWPSDGGPRRAGVSAFGIGGTNAHVVLEEAPAPPPSTPTDQAQLLVLSAKTETALRRMRADLAAHLGSRPELPLAEVAHTLQEGRAAHLHRWAAVARTADEARAALAGEPARPPVQRASDRNPPVAFLFPGGGTQHAGMARELYRREPVFRAEIDACARVLTAELGVDPRALLFPAADARGEAQARLEQVRYGLPALFAVEYALARQWMAWGVRPDAMLGHSIGEYVAAAVAGVFTREAALRLVTARARLIQSLPAGTMLAVPVPERELRPLLPARVALAAVNSASHCVVSGAAAEIGEVESLLAGRGVVARRIHVSHAGHSAAMDPILDAFAAEVRRAAPAAPSIPFLSNVTGDWITAQQATDPMYWVRHLRETVRFADGVRRLLEGPRRVLLEVGPGETLGTFARRDGGDAAKRVVVKSLPAAGQADASDVTVLEALGSLWAAGVEIDWPAFRRGERRRKVPLPTYPFERQEYRAAPVRSLAPSFIPIPVSPASSADADRAAPHAAAAHPSAARPGDASRSGAPPAAAREAAASFSADAHAADRRRAELADPHAADGRPADPGRAHAYSADPHAADARPADPERAHVYSADPSSADSPRAGSYPAGLDSADARPSLSPRADASVGERTADDGAWPPDTVAQAEGGVAGIFSALLGTPPDELDRDASFLQLGADSLLLMQASRNVETEFGVRIPFRQLLEELGTIDALAAYLAREASTRQPVAGEGEGDVPEPDLAETAARVAEIFSGILRTTPGRLDPTRTFLELGADSLLLMQASRTVENTFGVTVPFRHLLDDLSTIDTLAGHLVRETAAHGVAVPAADRQDDAFVDVRSGDESIGVPSSSPTPSVGTWRADDGFAPAGSSVADDREEWRWRAGDAGTAAASAGDAAVDADDGSSASAASVAPLVRHTPAPVYSPASVSIVPPRTNDLPAQGMAFSLTAAFGQGVAPAQAAAYASFATPMQAQGAVVPAGLQELVAQQLAVIQSHAALMQAQLDLIRGGPAAASPPLPPTDERPRGGDGPSWSQPSAVDPPAHLRPAVDGGEPIGGAARNGSRARTSRRRLRARRGTPAPADGGGSGELPVGGGWLNQSSLDQTGALNAGSSAAASVEEDASGERHRSGTGNASAEDAVALADRSSAGHEGEGWSGAGSPRASSSTVTAVARADRASEDRAAAALRTPIARAERTGERLPLSFAQERLWIVDRIDPGSAVYNVVTAQRMDGALDAAALEAALGEIVRRHEALRTTFRDHDGEPEQVIAPFSGFVLPVVDLTPLPGGERDREVARWIERETTRAFDLDRGPLFDPRLLRLGEAEHLLIVSMHHVVSDGLSVHVLIREMAALYAAFADGRPSPLPPLPVRYADFAAWQREMMRGAVLEGELAYWRERLAGAPALLALPTDFPRPAEQSHDGADERVAVPRELIRAVRAVGAAEGATLFVVLLAAYKALLARYCGSDDVVVGITTAGRPRPEVDGVIGYFSNTLAVRTELRGDPPFRQLLRRVRETMLGAQAHAELPFEHLVYALRPDRSLGHAPVVQTAFLMHHPEGADLEMAGVRVRALPVCSRTSKFDVSLAVAGETGQLSMEYRTDLFLPATIRRMLAHFRRILEQVAADPDVRLSALDLSGDAGDSD